MEEKGPFFSLTNEGCRNDKNESNNASGCEKECHRNEGGGLNKSSLEGSPVGEGRPTDSVIKIYCQYCRPILKNNIKLYYVGSCARHHR